MKVEFDPADYVKEIIEERSLTMDDGRPREVKNPKRTANDTKPQQQGPDDGDGL